MKLQEKMATAIMIEELIASVCAEHDAKQTEVAVEARKLAVLKRAERAAGTCCIQKHIDEHVLIPNANRTTRPEIAAEFKRLPGESAVDFELRKVGAAGMVA